MQPKHRPFGVTVLAIFAGIAAVIAFAVAIQFFFLPFKSPNISWNFFGAPWLSGFMYLILGLIYVWLVRMLWNVNPQGWLFLVVIAIFELIFSFVAILGGTSAAAMGPTILISGLILIYCLLPGTKKAFGTDVPAKADTPPPAPPAEPAS